MLIGYAGLLRGIEGAERMFNQLKSDIGEMGKLVALAMTFIYIHKVGLDVGVVKVSKPSKLDFFNPTLLYPAW